MSRLPLLPLHGQSRWHVVHTRPRQEFRALEQLRNQQYDCFLPTLAVERMRGRKIVVCEEPLFSRYLFIRIDHAAANCVAIGNTRGVRGLVAFGGRYASLPDGWIEALRNAPPAIHRSVFTPGEWVSIAAGPLAGREGIYHAPAGEARALVLIELMNQPQKLLVAMELLRKAA